MDTTTIVYSDSTQEKQDILFSPVGGLRADRGEIEKFVKTIFKHAQTGFVSLRCFTHKTATEKGQPTGGQLVKQAGEKHYIWPIAPVGDTEGLIAHAAEAAEWCANDPRECGVVFAPPLCTLTSRWGAKSSDMGEGVALSSECDNEPQKSLVLQREIFGAPTLVMESGGVWTAARQTG